MEKLRGSHLLDRGERFLSCWEELATPETEFAGIRHQELKDGVATAQAARERVRAVELWLRGLRLERDQADRLLAGNLGDASVMDRYFGRQLAGTFHFTSGDCPGAVKSLEEARAVPWPSQPWYRSYFLPLILHRLATCYEKAGDLPKARERNAEMLKRWERADPDLPLLIEAKAMRERLAGATDSASSSR